MNRWSAALAAFVLAAGTFVVTQLAVSSNSFWFTVLWTAWSVTALWTLTRSAFSPIFAAVTIAMLLFVLIPATAAQFFGQTTLAGNEYSAGIYDAYRIAALAQCGMLAGAIATRTSHAMPEFRRVSVQLSRRRLNWASWLSVLTGIAGIVGFSVLGGANLFDFITYTTSTGYGTFAHEATGDLGFLVAIQCIAGLAIVLIPLRNGSTGPGKWYSAGLVTLLATAVLLGGGQRARFFVPVIAAGLVWLKTSRRDIPQRRVVITGAIGIILLAAIVGIYRGSANTRTLTADRVLTAPFGSGNNLFLPLAGLAIVVPQELPYIRGASYLQTIVFPVPRALWRSKPTGDIATITNMIDPRNSGVAFPEFGEMYANFGLPGVLIGSVLFGGLVEWLGSRLAGAVTVRESVFVATCGAIVLELFTRGDIAPMLTAFLGLLLAAGLICRRRSPVLDATTVPPPGADLTPAEIRWPVATE